MTALSRRQLRGFLTPEAKLLRQVLSALIDALPKCKCGVVATMTKPQGLNRYVCDGCFPQSKKKKGGRLLAWGGPARRAYEVEFILKTESEG